MPMRKQRVPAFTQKPGDFIFPTSIATKKDTNEFAQKKAAV
jgi:hypothetical protein